MICALLYFSCKDRFCSWSDSSLSEVGEAGYILNAWLNFTLASTILLSTDAFFLFSFTYLGKSFVTSIWALMKFSWSLDASVVSSVLNSWYLLRIQVLYCSTMNDRVLKCAPVVLRWTRFLFYSKANLHFCVNYLMIRPFDTVFPFPIDCVHNFFFFFLKLMLPIIRLVSCN